MRDLRRWLAVGVAVALAGIGACSNGATSSTGPVHATLVVGEGGKFVRNFNPFAPGSTDPTRATIYEPLWIVSTAAKGKEYPWLATAYAWSSDLRTLTFTIRSGVRWSDGQQMTVDDVAFSLGAGKDNPAFNQGNLWGSTGLAESVSIVGKDKVSLTFRSIDTTVFARVVNSVYIVPKHVFGSLTDPAKFTNENPVGTGPFTRVKAFSSQSIDLGRNPYYWMTDKPAYDTLRFVDNTNAVVDLEAGTTDWNGAFVPDVQKVYDDRNPNFHHYYATASPAVVLFLNLAKTPFNSAAFRNGLSMAIDRTAIVSGAEFGDAQVADATGLNGLFPDWEPTTMSTEATTFDLNKAAAAMAQAGYTKSGSRLVDQSGKQVTISLLTNSDFPDYVAAAQVIARTWGQLGIAVNLKPAPWGDWYSNLSNGAFDAGISYTFAGVTPIDYYDQLLGGENASPAGKPAGANNYSRYSNQSLDALIAQGKTTKDKQSQKQLVSQMEQMVSGDLPVIPLFIPPIFYQYNTTRFTGWPTKDNYYVAGPPWAFPDRLVVITNVRPT